MHNYSTKTQFNSKYMLVFNVSSKLRYSKSISRAHKCANLGFCFFFLNEIIQLICIIKHSENESEVSGRNSHSYTIILSS